MQSINKSSPLLVTGATGFVASHIVKLLLERDFKVRGTVRSLAKKENYDFLYNLVPEKKGNLELVEANLDEKAGLVSAVEGCEYVFHVASPIPKNDKITAEEMINSAINGTKYVLEASVEKGVKKVVVTSSVQANMFGHTDKIITDENWSNEAECPPYGFSKTKAEKFVWDFYEKNKDKIQIATVNPALVLGPVFNKTDNTTSLMIGDTINGKSTGVMDLLMGIVDVRDVAETHFQAMFRDEANGKRYLNSAGSPHWREVVKILKDEFEKKGFSIADKQLSREEVEEKGTLGEKAHLMFYGVPLRFDNERSVKDLNLRYRPLEETVIDSANSLIQVGFVSKPQSS